MNKLFFRGTLAIILVLPLLFGSVASATTNSVATMVINPTLVYWEPLVSFDQLVLTVSGSGGAYIRQTFNAGTTPVFDLYDEYGNLFPDGTCTYELIVVPYVDPVTQALRQEDREAGIDTPSAAAPTSGLSQSGYFTIKEGLVILNTVSETVPAGTGGETIDFPQITGIDTPSQATGADSTMQTTGIDMPMDVQHLDDVIITGSLCVGFDCVNGENFGFDTLVLKENNLRILFKDTSASASFPSTDWRLIANDTSNGGASYFAIEDSDAGRRPFTVEAGSPSNTLYVDNAGRVGVGTSNPVVELHVKDGDTPTLRLEQDASSGFTAQTWDVSGNETNFFVRDATNGSKLPFRIMPDSESNTLVLKSDKVGVGTNDPSAPLHVKTTNLAQTSPLIIYEAAQSAETNRYPFMEYRNNGHMVNYLVDSGSDGSSWSYGIWDKYFIIDTPGAGGGWEFKLDENGNATIRGSLTASGSTFPTPDYVFDTDYQLMPLADLHEYVRDNKHLPNVPNSDELKTNGLNMTQMQMKLLEKIEELTLYTIAQQKTIDELKAKVDQLQK